MSQMASPGRTAADAPAFRQSMGVRAAALTYLGLMLIIPLAVILQDGLREGLSGLWQQVSLPLARSALGLTLWTAAVMTLINAVMGLLTAYVLERYDFPGKGVLNALGTCRWPSLPWSPG